MNVFKSQSRLQLIAGIIIFVAVVLVVLRLSLSTVIRYVSSAWFEEQGVEFSISDISISFIDSQLMLKDIKSKGSSEESFSIESVYVDWQWRPLQDNIVMIDEISLHKMVLHVASYVSGELNVGGLRIQSGTNPSANQSANIDNANHNSQQARLIIVNKLSLTDINGCYQQRDDKQILMNYCAQFDSLTSSGPFTLDTMMQASDSGNPLQLNGQINLNELIVNDMKSGLNLISLNTFSIEDISSDLKLTKLESIRLQGVQALQSYSSDQTLNNYLLKFKNMSVKPVSFIDGEKLAIGNISLDQPAVYYSYDRQGVSSIDHWLPANNNETTNKDSLAEKEASKNLDVRLEAATITSTQSLRYTDLRAGQELDLNVEQLDLAVKNIDTADDATITAVNLDMQLQKHASVKLDAQMSRLKDKPDITGKVSLKGLDLRMFKAITQKTIGHNIKSGQLDSEIDINIDKGNINSKIDLVLNQFALASLSKEEAEKLNNEFGFPLNASLSLLRDKDNAIRLSIPVSGDIENPEFDPRSVIVKASSKAITAAVLHYYSPFGLVLVAGSIFDLATALTFEPVIFEATATELTTDHKHQLDKLSKLLAERPGIHLTLCGFSSRLDKLSLFPVKATVKSNVDDAAVDQKDNLLTAEQKEILLDLADKRSLNVKTYLVSLNSDVASRLVLCEAEYDEDHKAGVFISL